MKLKCNSARCPAANLRGRVANLAFPIGCRLFRSEKHHGTTLDSFRSTVFFSLSSRRSISQETRHLIVPFEIRHTRVDRPRFKLEKLTKHRFYLECISVSKGFQGCPVNTSFAFFDGRFFFDFSFHG